MIRRERRQGFISANEMLAAAALRKNIDGRGETTVTSTGTNFVRVSQTIANKHMSLLSGRARNSLSEV